MATRQVEYIAEIGKNWCDSSNPSQTVEDALLQAKRLAHKAKLAGATVAKYQVHCLDDEKEKRDKSRWGWIARNEELTPYDEFWVHLEAYVRWLGLEFLCTPMSRLAAVKINPLVSRWKVSSADLTDFELLKYLKSTGKPIILSTGMSTDAQISKAVKFLGKQIEFINYCISSYPCGVHKINFRRLLELEKYGYPTGFSDHSLSIEAPALAVRMGAVAIEKHFTLSRDLYGPDHKVSLLPDEFKKMVELCKLAETDGESFEQEKEFWSKFRVKNKVEKPLFSKKHMRQFPPTPHIKGPTAFEY